MKDLFVGDLHIQISNLEESEKLLSFISRTFIENNCRNLVLLGDIFHTHAVIRQEVAYTVLTFLKGFYYNAVKADKSRIIIIAGNHDGISPTNASKNALDLILSDYATVVSNKDGLVKDGYVFLPFIHNTDEFIEAAVLNKITATSAGLQDPILVCHQTFDGAAYESGMLCPAGVKSELLPYSVILSGHIHKRQTIKDKVIYVGTPRAITAAENNEDKFIHLVYKDDSGKLNLNEITTRDIVKNYYVFEVYEENPETYSVDLGKVSWEKDIVTIRINGTQIFYEKFLKANEQYLGKVRFIPRIKRDLSKKISMEKTGDSIEVSLEKYIKDVVDLDDEMKEEVWKTINQMII